MTNGKGPQMRKIQDKIRDGGQFVVGQVQDTELLETGNKRRDVFEALITEVQLAEICCILISHWDALTLQGRSMEGSDVKQRDDDLARHGW